jgi:ATP synthase protein I
MQSVDALVLRGAAVPTAVVGVAAIGISAAVAGSGGALGALFGALIVLAFFTVGQVVLGRVLRDNPQMAMTVAMTLYLVKIGVLFGLIVLFQGTTAFDTKVFGLTIVACTLTWTVAEVWVFARTKVLYVEPGTGSGGSGSGGPR